MSMYDLSEAKENRLSLRQKVYALLKQEIITCVLPPGAQIVEGDLAERFQISKTPIREALTSLQQENLVEYRTNKGFVVSIITLKDIQEIYEARIFFESTFIRLAVKNITDSELDALQRYQDVVYDLQDPITVKDYIKANSEFHMRIAYASHNSRLCRYYESLMDDAHRLIYMDVRYHNVLDTWHRSHQRIIDALRARDAEAGVRATEETLENGKKRILGN